MNDVILWCVLALQGLFHFIVWVTFLSISLFFFFFCEVYCSSVKWSVLAHLKSQPRGQNFQAQFYWSVLAHIILEPTKIPKTHLK